MTKPLVSVIIPTYGGMDHLGAAIHSVLNQTYRNLELIVVNDFSPDNTGDLVRHFDDPRLMYIKHETNLGAMAARLTGLQASSGELIAFLDQDDMFHEDKLRVHVAYLERYPDIGLTHNGRFLIEGDQGSILRIWQPPSSIGLEDLVLGYPISPSDSVLRRKWATLEEIWDDSYARRGEEFIVNGGEIVIYGRLWMAGCRFGTINRALNYRRLHPARVLSNLGLRCSAELMCQEIALSDPRCPAEMHKIRDLAASNIYLMFAYCALNQEEPDLAEKLLRAAIGLNPDLIKGEPCELARYLATDCSQFDSIDHIAVTERVFNTLPGELQWLAAQKEWAIARGYLIRGTRNAIWDRMANVDHYFAQAGDRGATVDAFFVEDLSSQLKDCELEFGADAVNGCLDRVTPYLERVAGDKFVHRMMGQLAISQAFQLYATRQYGRVAARVGRAIFHDPAHLTDRGVLSILARSQMRLLRSGLTR